MTTHSSCIPIHMQNSFLSRLISILILILATQSATALCMHARICAADQELFNF